MASFEERDYTVDCPFCRIAQAYPPEQSPVPANPLPTRLDPECYLIISTPHVMAFLDIMPMAPGHILLTTRDHYGKLSELHPPVPTQTQTEVAPQTASGEQLVIRNRNHSKETARELGFWLPILSRALCAVTGAEDWNVVQNNGERAAQVVPHIHFHFIPRYQETRRGIIAGAKAQPSLPVLRGWRMFARGPRHDLNEDDAAELAALFRDEIRRELGEHTVTATHEKAKL